MRMEAAAARLAKGDPVKEAAPAAGYNWPEHFSRAFKRRHGYPPSRAGNRLNP